jgi:hypothetical protein
MRLKRAIRRLFWYELDRPPAVGDVRAVDFRAGPPEHMMPASG